MFNPALSALIRAGAAERIAGPLPDPVVVPTQSSRFELCLDPCGQPFVRPRLSSQEARMSAESIKPGSRVTVEATVLREGRDGALFIRFGDDAFASAPRAAVRSVEPPPVKVGDRFRIGGQTLVVEGLGLEIEAGAEAVAIAAGDLFAADGTRLGAMNVRRDWLADQARV